MSDDKTTLQLFNFYFKEGGLVSTFAASFEVESGMYPAINFYTETGEKAAIHVPHKQVAAIVPDNQAGRGEQEFQVHLKSGTLIHIRAHHFVIWSDNFMSFRDADNKHLPDVYVVPDDALAIVPLGSSVPAQPEK